MLPIEVKACERKIYEQGIDKKKNLSISEVSKLTGVQPGTIRFYEKCGFLEEVERSNNRYRIFHWHHVIQVKVCRLVFGGFVNKNLRRVSKEIIEGAKNWNLQAYEVAVLNYKKAIEDDIFRTEEAVKIAMCQPNVMEEIESEETFTKKQASQLVGVSCEAIRNWERNGLLPQSLPYQKRYYTKTVISRMYIIRLLLDTGYSIMAIQQFFRLFDEGKKENAKEFLMDPVCNEELCFRADKYMQTLKALLPKTEALYQLLQQMN